MFYDKVNIPDNVNNSIKKSVSHQVDQMRALGA